MKILGINFGQSETPNTQDNNTFQKKMGFSTPFGTIGDGDLTKPYISNSYSSAGVINFGVDNLYPQLLNQLYYTSSLHAKCVDYLVNASIGGGYNWIIPIKTSQDKLDILTIEKKFKLKKLLRKIAKAYVIHNRVHILVVRDKDLNIVKLELLDPSTIRNTKDGQFVYNSDWSKGLVETETLSKYHPLSKKPRSIYVYEEPSAGQDIYALPTYIGVNNWLFLDGESAYLQKENIRNSIYPSAVIKRPKEFSSIDELNTFKSTLSTKKGASNAGNILVLTGNGMDDVPEYIPVSTANNNDKLFIETNKEIKDQICFAHGINPSIMGIKVAGSLGNAQELETAYKIIEKNVILPLREIIEEIFSDVVGIVVNNNKIEINEFSIVDLPKVLEKEPLNFESKSVSTPQPTDSINEALKGLTGKENLDIIRILRDHSKGKINDTLATTRLLAYGFTKEQAKEILEL